MAKYPNPFFQHDNSIFTNSHGYDPMRQPPFLRIRIADGASLVDNLAERGDRIETICASAVRIRREEAMAA